MTGNMLTTTLVALSVVGSICFAKAPVPRSTSPTAAEEAKKIQGEWEVFELNSRGEKYPKDHPEVKNMRVLIKGEELTFLAVNKGGDRKTTFKLNPAKSPKQIDITSLDGQETGQTAACIYVLGKDQLTICMPFLIDPTLRPSEFKSTADNGLMVIVLVKLPAK